MGNESIDLGLENIYCEWFVYRKGKKPSRDLDDFQYNLDEKIHCLHMALNDGTYKHSGYRKFTVTDNKKREISVASVEDRVVHRLLYDYLVEIFDKTFIYDAWSCRKGKGLIGGINRVQQFMRKYQDGFVWRADIRKFFDNVDHNILFRILKRKVQNKKALLLMKEVIDSFEIGMPIGNLTSQVFSNIYLNELDRFVKHDVKCKAYVRYGDDFVIFDDDKERLEYVRKEVRSFIENNLKLHLHLKNDLIVRTKHGLKFLGVVLYPNGRKLIRRSKLRIRDRINLRNSSSYWGVIFQHGSDKNLKDFQWSLIDAI